MGDNDKPKVGVFVCHCGKNIADVVDVSALAEYAKTLPNVTVAMDYKFMCSKNGQELITEELQAKRINRVVVAACSPLMHEPTFRRVLVQNEVNQFYFEQANIREHVSWVNMGDHAGADEVARDHLKMAVAKVSENKELSIQKFPVLQEVLIVGGGITGMFAALDLANKYKVHLVERSATIGGHMAQLDKTFPTMDCSACIITPKMVEVGRHPNINLLTYSEIEDAELVVGNFKIKVRKKTRRINMDICTGCGACGTVCPVTVPDEFNENLSHRAAAYIPFPQAVPGKYTIDVNACIECGLCVAACEPGAVDLSLKDEIINLDVGAVILASGYDAFDPTDKTRFGYDRFTNVLTGLEMERLLSSFGPTLGKVVRPSDHKKPKKIAFLQCVGSRDFHEGAHNYCSRVCCMYAMKQARQFKEKYPDSQVYIFYMDIRAFGKGYEEFYEIASREYGISFVRGRIGDVMKTPDDGLLLRGSDTLLAEKFEIKVDMLVLSVGLEARSDSSDLGRTFGVQNTVDGAFMEAHPKLRPVDSLSAGIFIAGACQGPKDIPDSVAQAKAAASSADNFLAAGEVEVEPYYSYVRNEFCSGCRSCITVCPYDAITFDEEKNVSVISTKKCKGCGVCMITCPSAAIVQNHFTKAQIVSEILSLTPWQE
jgi:heterodisulfide reductase subunit A2